MEITIFFSLWKLNAIISIQPIQNTEGVDRTDRQVEGSREMQSFRGLGPTSDHVAESFAGTRMGAHLFGGHSSILFVSLLLILFYFFGL